MGIKNDVITAVAEHMPGKKLSLPLYGFLDQPTYHILLCNPTAKDIWKRMSKTNIISLFRNIYLFNIFIGQYISRFSTIMFSMEFHGIQQMRFKGFTEYTDQRIDSYTTSLKYVLNPDEYVLWNTPVHSMTDGEVVEINNSAPDMISRTSIRSIGLNTSVKELYGNYIIIRTNELDYVYAGLQRDSMRKYAIGDKVQSGDIIGKVGCCGKLGVKPFLHVECRLAFSIPYVFENIYFPLPMLNFEPFYQVRLINETRNTPEALERMYAKDIQYTYNAGSLMSDGTLIRKALNFK
jgi:hypothetical protein